MLRKSLSVTVSSYIQRRELIHAGRASRDFTSLLQTIQFTPAIGLGLAHHVVIVVGFAAGADKEGGAEEGCGGSSDFLDLGDILRQRSGVNEHRLVESESNLIYIKTARFSN